MGKKKAKKPVVKPLVKVEDGETKRNRIMRLGASPYVVYSFLARQKIDYIVGAVGTEVGWIGLVQPDADDPLCLNVVDIELTEQTVASTTCTLTAEGKAESSEILFDRYPDLTDAYIGYWGHSHVNMQASPSGQDVDTAMENSDTPSIYLAAIHNKRGDVHMDVYDFKTNIFYDDVEVYDEGYFTAEEKGELDDLIDELLTQEVYVSKMGYGTYKPKALPASGESYTYHQHAMQATYDKYGWQSDIVLKSEFDDDMLDSEYWEKWDKENSYV